MATDRVSDAVGSQGPRPIGAARSAAMQFAMRLIDRKPGAGG